jgi:hypothetical protein
LTTIDRFSNFFRLFSCFLTAESFRMITIKNATLKKNNPKISFLVNFAHISHNLWSKNHVLKKVGRGSRQKVLLLGLLKPIIGIYFYKKSYNSRYKCKVAWLLSKLFRTVMKNTNDPKVTKTFSKMPKSLLCCTITIHFYHHSPFIDINKTPTLCTNPKRNI